MSEYSGTRNQHNSFPDLQKLLIGRFQKRAKAIRLSKKAQKHFKVHCLKHDLEVLIIASPEQLRRRLGLKKIPKKAWRKPVENHDDNDPPKRVVERLFSKHKKRKYRDTVDAPWILGLTSLPSVEKACPQQFTPFVNTLEDIIAGN